MHYKNVLIVSLEIDHIRHCHRRHNHRISATVIIIHLEMTLQPFKNVIAEIVQNSTEPFRRAHIKIEDYLWSKGKDSVCTYCLSSESYSMISKFMLYKFFPHSGFIRPF